MRRLTGIVLILLICGIVGYAFSPRPHIPKPPTVQRFDRILVNDAARIGERILAVGDAGRIFISDDDGESWQFIDSKTRSSLTRLRVIDEQTAYAVGHDAVILQTADAGKTWTELYSAPDAESPLMDVLAINQDRLVAIGAYHQYLQSDDGGQSWNPVQVSDDDKHFNAIARMGEQGLLLLGEAGTVKYSRDLGKTWANVATPYAGSYFGAVVVDEKTAIVYGMRGKMFRFVVGGKGLEPIENPSKASLLGGVMRDGQILLCGQDGTVLISRDAGATFTLQQTPGNRVHTALIARKDGQWLALGEQGAVRFTPLAPAQARSQIQTQMQAQIQTQTQSPSLIQSYSQPIKPSSAQAVEGRS